MDFFKIPSKKFDRYARKYFNRPITAYSRLAMLACKMIIKQFIDDAFRLANRNKEIRIAIILEGGLGDILFGVIYADSFIKQFALDKTVSIFIEQSVGAVKTLLNDRNDLDFRSLNEFTDCDFELVLSLTMMFPRAVRFTSAVEKDQQIFSYIKSLRKFEEEATWILGEDRQVNQLLWMLGSRLNRFSALTIGGLNIDKNFNLQVPDEGYKIFERYPELSKNKFITISRSVDKNSLYKDSIRLWSEDKYKKFIFEFKRIYPEYKIVYLGGDRTSYSKLNGVDVDLVGETSMAELMALLKESKVHLDGECGMVHIRHFICQKPSVVLFGPTSPKLKGYKENINIRNDEYCSLPMCEHILLEGQWSKKCLMNKLGTRAACIEAISVKQVIDSLKILL